MKENTIQKTNVELTIRGVLLGTVLSLVLCAANTYLGLYAGMTVAASIPAAVISMGILRGVFKKATILENNIVQTTASAGESLAAGIIFTIPAFIITGVWQEFNYFIITAVAILGGILGIVFMVPLREALVVRDKNLVFPEGVACAEVLRAGEGASSGIKKVLLGIAAGGILKLLSGVVGLVKGTVEIAFKAKNTIFYLGTDISGALFGVGFIVGFQIAAQIFLGGVIAWIVSIPIVSNFIPVVEPTTLDSAWELWDSQIRFMGVGAMIVGGVYSIFSVRKALVTGIKQVFSKSSITDVSATNLSPKVLITILVLDMIGIFILYYILTDSIVLTIFSTLIMVLLSFFLVAVATYICGLVGSSNNPVSGMTITALFFTIFIMFLFKLTGNPAIIATLGVAGVVCCATCTSGDVAQDLKTGFIVGARPSRQQIVQIIGTVAAAFIITPILVVLSEAYGIGTGEPGSLKAPQATLFASIVGSFFETGDLNYEMLIYGMFIGAAIIIINTFTSKKGFPLYLMPIAVGIYLPLSLSFPIFLGGLMQYFLTRKGISNKNGILFSSGLIAGEAIIGILIAVFITLLPYLEMEDKIDIPFNIPYAAYFSIVIFGLLIYMVYHQSKSKE